MPNYTFRCPNCSYEYNDTLPINHDMPLCKKCKIKMNHVMGPSTIIYKGGGFYTTDYKDKEND